MSIAEFRDEDVTIQVSHPAIPNAELFMRIVHVPSGVMVEGRGHSHRRLMNTLLPKLREQWSALQENRKPRIELSRSTIFALREVFGMLKTEIDKAERSSGNWMMEVERAEEVSDKASEFATLLARQVHHTMKS